MNIGVLGIGRLGLCLTLLLEKGGNKLLCYDVNSILLESIKNKTLKSEEPFVEELLLKSKNIIITNIINQVFDQDIIFIVVATPSLEDGSYNHSSLDNIFNSYKLYAKEHNITKNTTFIVCSTVMPKYCDQIQKSFDDENIKVEINYNPEFIAQGSIIKNMANPDMVLIGEHSVASGDHIENVYKTFLENKPKFCRMSPLEAEITKISLNCFLTTKITFANRIGDMVHKLGYNPRKVLQCIGSDSRVGSKYFSWGHGFGGPCFPRDNRALTVFSNSVEITNDIGIQTDLSNKKHLDYLTNYIKNTVSKETQLYFSYLTYKDNSIILEESQQLKLAINLLEAGYTIYVNERESVKTQLMKMYPLLSFIFISDKDPIENMIDINKLIN
jgi:nucleotide sugar dehydrogenase